PFKFFPGFSKARISVQIMGMFYLALAVMSAIGAKVIFEKKISNRKFKIGMQILMIVISFFVVFDIFSHGYNKRFYSEKIGSPQFKQAPLNSPFRISDENHFLDNQYDWEYFNIENIWGKSGIRIKKYDDLFTKLENNNWKPINNKLYDFLNVGFIITSKKLPPQNKNFLLRAYLVENYKVVNDKEAYNLIKQGDVDFKNEVLLNKEPEYLGIKKETASPISIKIVKRDPSYIKINTNLSKKAILVMSEVDYNGWNLYVDGKPQNYITANYTFRAVALNPGNHIVEFKYRPFDVYIGATLSILSICILIFVAIKAVKK
ncbi:YfhO family protein, partial [bacterium]|nr:YfhO family protein [bacterium]